MIRMLVCLAGLLMPLHAHADAAAPPKPAPRFVEAGLSAVARVSSANTLLGRCTAVLISPNVALTAGHCAGGPLEGPGALQLVFNPGEPQSSLRVTVRAVAYHADFAPMARGTQMGLDDSLSADLALLQLARDVPAEVARPIPLAPAPRDDAPPQALPIVSIYGYINGQTDLLHGHGECRLGRIDEGLLGSNCRVLSGLSGAPVLSGGPENWRVEGIAVASVDAPPLRSLIVDVVPWPEFAGPAALSEPPSAQGETSP